MKCTTLDTSNQLKRLTLTSVPSRLFGENLTSRLTRTQNRKLLFIYIDHNKNRLIGAINHISDKHVLLPNVNILPGQSVK